jgi:CRISPR-associated endonuclease/helicase Cas3
VWDEDAPPDGMRHVRTIDIRPEDDGDDATGAAAGRIWRWYVRSRGADDDGSGAASVAQDLDAHLQTARAFAGELAQRLALEEPAASAVIFAAQRHDAGKYRALWQRSIGNRDFPSRVLAKSGDTKMRLLELSHYRHELGSLVDISRDPEFRRLGPASQDLVLHMIAAHHGRARPHFSAEESFDPEHPDSVVRAAAREAPARFARLQRRYGRWGLAYLESLVRAADIVASQSTEAQR